MIHRIAVPCRRFNPRIGHLQNVWICWNCKGRDDVSKVRDLSLGGFFLNTRTVRAVGTTIKVDFLVREGQIRADAVVMHSVPDQGWGLRFTGITEQDRPRFATLMRRLRSYANEIEQGTVRGVLRAS